MAYKKIFLTFDDGPGPKTAEIAELLNTLGVKATFFMVGEKVKEHPEAVKRVAELGHVIGVHGYEHEDPARLNKAQTMGEIARAVEQIKAVTDKEPTLFRAAYGMLSPQMLSALKKLGLKHVDWSLDSLDWKAAEKIESININKIVKKARNGDVVLFHDSGVKEYARDSERRGRNLIAALPHIVNGLRGKGFEFRPVRRNIQLRHRVKYAVRVAGKYGRAHVRRLAGARKRRRS